MKACTAAMLRRSIAMFSSTGILLFFVSVLPSSVLAQDDITLKRDKDKTVYTIDSSDEPGQEAARDRERAWDMLRNMGIIMDGGQGKSAKSQPQPPTPHPAPLSGK